MFVSLANMCKKESCVLKGNDSLIFRGWFKDADRADFSYAD